VGCGGDAGVFERRAGDCDDESSGVRADGDAAAACGDADEGDGDVDGEKMNLDYPFRFDGRGRTAATTDDDHIRDMIEQVLFTMPGERVNRPTFGSGLLQLVFAPNSDALAAATQLSVQASLQQWLGDLILVQRVDVVNVDSRLEVTVEYVVRRTQEARVAQFSRAV
jgi:phage baseplate assembly protein W